MKILVIYLIGLVFFVAVPYILVQEDERPSSYHFVFLIWAVFWPLFLTLWLFGIVAEYVKEFRVRRRM